MNIEDRIAEILGEDEVMDDVKKKNKKAKKPKKEIYIDTEHAHEVMTQSLE